MCCTRLAGNPRRKNYAKNRHLRIIAQRCRAIFSQLRHVSTIALVKQKHLSTCPHNMVNFGPLMTEISWRVWGPQQISTGFACWLRYCSDVAQRRSNNLCTMFDRLLGWYTIYTFWRLLPPNGVLLVQKSLCVRPSLAFCYIGSVTARHSSMGMVGVSQTLRRGTGSGIAELSLLVIFNRRHHLYSDGSHHIGHRPTF